MKGRARPQTRQRLRERELGLAPREDYSLQLMSTARRYARADRRGNPIHCDHARKLMYETDEIARSTGQQLARLSGLDHFLYRCPAGSHWHLTTEPEHRGIANEKA